MCIDLIKTGKTSEMRSPNKFRLALSIMGILTINLIVALHSLYQDSSLFRTCIIILVNYGVLLGSPELKLFNDKLMSESI